jgi:hypothetical protein
MRAGVTTRWAVFMLGATIQVRVTVNGIELCRRPVEFSSSRLTPDGSGGCSGETVTSKPDLASYGHLPTLAHSWSPVFAHSSRSRSKTDGSPFQCTPSHTRLNEAYRGRQPDR